MPSCREFLVSVTAPSKYGQLLSAPAKWNGFAYIAVVLAIVLTVLGFSVYCKLEMACPWVADKMAAVIDGRVDGPDDVKFKEMMDRYSLTSRDADVQRFVTMVRVGYRYVPAAFAVLLLLELLVKLVGAWILGTIAVYWAKGKGMDVPIFVAHRVAMYAMTLPVILQWWVFPLWGVMPWSLLCIVTWWGVSLYYLTQGVKSWWASQPAEPPATGTGAPATRACG